MTILLYGDTVRSAAMRHEVPLEIIDPFLLVADERLRVLTSSLEGTRIAGVLPDAELCLRRGSRLARARREGPVDRGGGARDRGPGRRPVGAEGRRRARRPAGRGRRPAPCRGRHGHGRLSGGGRTPPGQERGRAGGHPARPAGGGGRPAGRRGADPRLGPRGREADLRRRGADGGDGAGDDPRGVRGGGRPGAAGHHGRLRVVRRRRPRSRLRSTAGRPSDRDRPVAARRAERLLGRHDPDVRGRRGHAPRSRRCATSSSSRWRRPGPRRGRGSPAARCTTRRRRSSSAPATRPSAPASRASG